MVIPTMVHGYKPQWGEVSNWYFISRRPSEAMQTHGLINFGRTCKLHSLNQGYKLFIKRLHASFVSKKPFYRCDMRFISCKSFIKKSLIGLELILTAFKPLKYNFMLQTWDWLIFVARLRKRNNFMENFGTYDIQRSSNGMLVNLHNNFTCVLSKF